MISLVLIILSIVFGILLLVVATYTLIVYIHPDDKAIGTAWYSKILVIIGLLLCWSQALLLPLDIANNQLGGNGLIGGGGLNLKLLWYIVYFSILALVTAILPFAIFFYQCDEQRSFGYRICSSLIYTIISIAIVGGIIFGTFTVFNKVNLPVATVTIDFNNETSSSDFSDLQPIAYTPIYQNIQLTTSFPVYVMAIMSFFGWLFLILFGGVGLFSLPLDLLKQFYLRPLPRKSDEMKEAKQKLLREIGHLTKTCQQLKEEEKKFSKNNEDGWFTKFRKKRAIQNKINRFMTKFNMIQQQYEIFQLELQYFESNPFLPIAKCFLGFVFFCTASLWIFQMVVTFLKLFNNTTIISLDDLLNHLSTNNLGFISFAIYAYMCLYLVWSVQKGNIKYGVQIPFLFKFHPMKMNETWMNSFMFNLILMLIASVGISQLCVSCFPIYSQNSQIYEMFGSQLKFMKFFETIYQHGYLLITMVGWSLLSMILVLISFYRPSEYQRSIKAIRKKSRMQ